MRPECGLMTELCPQLGSRDSNGVTTQRVRMPPGGQIPSKQGISLHSGGLLRRRRSFLVGTSCAVRVPGQTALSASSLLGVPAVATGLRGASDLTELPGRRLASPGRRRRGYARRSGREGHPRSQHRNLHADRAVRPARATSVAQRRLAADSPGDVTPGCRAGQGAGGGFCGARTGIANYQHRSTSTDA
jgi:hypothetical protein